MSVTLSETLLVALGGAGGAVVRFLVQHSQLCSVKTYNTMIVNLAGCLLIGIVWALFMRFQAPGWLSRLVVAGFLGGFTTFSAFALDVVAMSGDGRLREALVYLSLSVIGGVALCLAALKATTAILNTIAPQP